MNELKNDIKVHFRDTFREARYLALLNSEDFTPLLHTIENFGAYLNSISGDERKEGLFDLKVYLKEFLNGSPYVHNLPMQYPFYHKDFEFLFDYVKNTRNEFAHKGVIARQKTRFILELCLIFESKLNELKMTASNYAVTGVVTAELWQPLGFIRREMLINSFSYIPILVAGKWKLISDFNLAIYLDGSNNRKKNKEGDTIEKAIENDKHGSLILINAKTVYPTDEIIKSDIKDSKPILVVDKNDKKRLYGLFTAFDLL